MFDGCFRYAAFEDGEFALRLTARGLRILYCADAIGYHEHWMDVESFAKREYNVGRMAVVFYRKHPKLDDELGVRLLQPAVRDLEPLPERLETLLRLHAFAEVVNHNGVEAVLASVGAAQPVLDRYQRPVRAQSLRARHDLDRGGLERASLSRGAAAQQVVNRLTHDLGHGTLVEHRGRSVGGTHPTSSVEAE